MSYRSDIDGLRALAILSILVFHIDPRFSGGYVGVDVFFVISGFLITGVIWEELKTNNFSYSNFYLKRIRRLFPALLIMLGSLFLIVMFFGLTTEKINYGKSVISSIWYVSNLFFYTQNDYFASDLELNPLLHTWSLSVEEQFYILFPIFLVFAFKNRKNILIYFFVFFLLSLILSESLLTIDKPASFFLSPSRFWQFLAGSIIAVHREKLTYHKINSEVFSIFGFILILTSLIFFSKETKFPGLNAILPTLGTALLIIGGQNSKTMSFNLLSSPIPKFFGNISYSLYLWHWPIIVLYKTLISPALYATDKLFLFFASIALGYCSWKFVEKPTRKICIKKEKYKLFCLSVPPLAAITSMGFAASNSNWMDFSYGEKFEKYVSYTMQARPGKCFLHSKANDPRLYEEDQCIKLGNSNNIILIGDSHAAQYYAALERDFPKLNVSQVTASGCKPLISLEGERRCTELMARVFNEFLDKYKFNKAIIAARWQAEDVKNLKVTLDYLKDKVKEIIVLGPVVEYKQALPILLARYKDVNSTTEPFQITLARNLLERKIVDDTMKSAVSETSATYISVLSRMCPKDECVTLVSGVPVQFDNGHLTTEGASFILHDIF